MSKNQIDRTALSFDGKGINGPDEHRSRIATFTSADAAKEYGRLFEASPVMLVALRLIASGTEDVAAPFRSMPASVMQDIARRAIRELS